MMSDQTVFKFPERFLVITRSGTRFQHQAGYHTKHFERHTYYILTTSYLLCNKWTRRNGISSARVFSLFFRNKLQNRRIPLPHVLPFPSVSSPSLLSLGFRSAAVLPGEGSRQRMFARERRLLIVVVYHFL